MSLEDLLDQLVHRNIQLSVDGSQLVCRGPKGSLPHEIQEQLVLHKSALLVLLAPNPASPPRCRKVRPWTTRFRPA